MLWWLAQNALVAGLLTGLVALACRLGRFGPAARHALWLVVLVKLLTPPFIQWPWALPGVTPVHSLERAAVVVIANEEGLPSLLELQTIWTADEPLPSAEPPLPPRHAADHDETLPATRLTESGWLAALLYYLWLAGTAIMCLLQLVRIARFRRSLARAQPAPRWLENLVATVAATLGVRPPLTLVVPGIGSPFLWSLGRPKMVWPASLLERLPHHCQRTIVAHELAHLRRRDHWVGWLQLVAECLWWWNPLFWYVRRQLRLQAELACDAWVVSTLPGDRRAYAEALIEVTELISPTAAPVPALGMSSAARQDFERRLTVIMRDCTPCRVPLVGLLAIGVLALISLPHWSPAQAQVQKRADTTQTSRPEKQLILEAAGDVDYLNVLNVLQEVQQTEGDRRVWIGLADSASPPERERRLQKLEEQLQELLKEVQALRAGDSKPQTIIRTDQPAKPGEPSDRPRLRIIERKHSEIRPDAASVDREDTKRVPPSAVRVEVAPRRAVEKITGTVKSLRDGKETVRVMTLSRATYKLPHAKAEALASLLRQHSKVEVLEARVDGDSLVITTTPGAQMAINHFISLIEGGTVDIDGRDWN